MTNRPASPITAEHPSQSSSVIHPSSILLIGNRFVGRSQANKLGFKTIVTRAALCTSMRWVRWATYEINMSEVGEIPSLLKIPIVCTSRGGYQSTTLGERARNVVSACVERAIVYQNGEGTPFPIGKPPFCIYVYRTTIVSE